VDRRLQATLLTPLRPAVPVQTTIEDLRLLKSPILVMISEAVSTAA
jgi:hypothetical protein